MLDVEKIERLRKKAGLTLEEAAQRAGFSGRSYWRDVVSGRRSNVSMEVLDRIAKALDVNPSELIK